MTWTLNFVKPLKPLYSASPLIQEWDDLLLREAKLGIRYGQPILLPSSGRPDVNVVRYLNSGTFCRLSMQTQHSYAKDLKVYFSFLDSQQKTWVQASEDDLENYEYWRRRDTANNRRVSGTKFARELASIQKFYKWQVSQSVIETSPVTYQVTRHRNGSNVESLTLAPKNIRRTNVKWLTPRAYRKWRDVGFAGYNNQGLRDPKWRGRLEGRNIAFSDLLWSSGLRLTEGASLLVEEMPKLSSSDRFVRGRIAEAVAKYGSKRDFWLSANVLGRVIDYIEVDRGFAIARAQNDGRYDEIENRIVVQKITNNRIMYFTDENGHDAHASLDQISTEMRKRLYFRRNDKYEPAALWLGEGGMPLPVETWESVFKVANERCRKNSIEFHCHPHMLRHSFALKMLVTLMHVFDRRMNLTPEDRREYRMIFGDPWTLVQTLLGHSSPTVTRDIYLEPVKGIQIDLFLNDALDENGSIDELLSRIAADSSLIEDI